MAFPCDVTSLEPSLEYVMATRSSSSSRSSNLTHFQCSMNSDSARLLTIPGGVPSQREHRRSGPLSLPSRLFSVSSKSPLRRSSRPVNFLPYALVTTVSVPCFGIPSLCHALASRTAYRQGNLYEAWHHSKMALVFGSIGNMLLAAILLLAVTMVMLNFRMKTTRGDVILLGETQSRTTPVVTSTPDPELEHIQNLTEVFRSANEEDDISSMKDMRKAFSNNKDSPKSLTLEGHFGQS